MTKKLIKAKEGEIVGTHYLGEIRITYRKLVTIFGKPHSDGDGYKIDAQWAFITPSGPVTIYNYKDGKNYLGDKGCVAENIVEWHIGGKNPDCMNYIVEELKDKNAMFRVTDSVEMGRIENGDETAPKERWYFWEWCKSYGWRQLGNCQGYETEAELRKDCKWNMENTENWKIMKAVVSDAKNLNY